MGREIERKFLVTNDSWRADADAGEVCKQGYLAVGPPVAVRVRVMGGRAWINVKKATLDIVRDEFEYLIPISDAEQMLHGLCKGHAIEKRRHKLAHEGFVWEIDVFEGVNVGLVVAEVELEDAACSVPLPPWIGREVSGDPRYLNTSLSLHPFREW